MHNIRMKESRIEKGGKRLIKLFGGLIAEHTGSVIEETCIAIKVVFTEAAKTLVKLSAGTVDNALLTGSLKSCRLQRIVF